MRPDLRQACRQRRITRALDNARQIEDHDVELRPALRHRGRADIASAQRAGTRVTIRLPVAPPRASSGR